MNGNVSWFEIPSADFERATNFYSTILNDKLRAGEFMGVPHGFFDNKAGQSGGAVIPNTDAALYAGGPLIYLLVEKIDEVVGRVESAGGVVLLPKTSIGPQGYIAVIRDTEGNRVGLHAVSAQGA